MRNKELEQCLVPGRTSFILNTNEKESYTTKFRDTNCRLIKYTKQKNWYLIETKQSFQGVHFSKGAVESNRFLILIRNPLKVQARQKAGRYCLPAFRYQ
jgi:hypothetical protein